MDSMTALASTLQKRATFAFEGCRGEVLGSQDENIGLETVFEQGLDGVLRGFGLHLTRGGHEGISVRWTRAVFL